MAYRKLFDPKPLFQDFRDAEDRQRGTTGDRRDGKVYSYTEPLVLAINVALATGRPLLLRGSPGCGKSSVAYSIARVMKRRYYEKVISSRMGANDLLWRFDAVRRLGDAQVVAAGQARKGDGEQGPRPWESYYPYIEPEVLWWIFDGDSAGRRGLPKTTKPYFERAKDPVVYKPDKNTPFSRAVILLDEIDKAEPDVPNNLLVALGSQQFQVEEIQATVSLRSAGEAPLSVNDLPLVVITTNEERQLPAAFLRRCVVFRFEPVSVRQLVELAVRTEGEQDRKLYEKVATTMERLATERAESTREAFVPSIAEYLDAVRASRAFGGAGIKPAVLEEILDRTTWKNPHRQ